MIENILKLFSEKMHPAEIQTDLDDKKVIIACCALLLEMAHADDEFDEIEKNDILNMLKQSYHLTEADARQLMALAESERRESLDLWQFTNLINQHYSPEQKLKVIAKLWQIIYTDGKVDQHEDYLMRKLTYLLELSHDDMITAKLKARDMYGK
jgi:uncharacterized tellurite resistance protein B-like protein